MGNINDTTTSYWAVTQGLPLRFQAILAAQKDLLIKISGQKQDFWLLYILV